MIKNIIIPSLALFILVFTHASGKPLPIIDIDESISINFLMGKFKPSKQPHFTRISTRYASRKGMYLQKESYTAFKKMAKAAKRKGIKLIIRSATRTHSQQKVIWEAKWTGKRRVGQYKNITKHIKDPEKRALAILNYSSMPGTSRHHWGTDIDLNSFNNRYFKKGKGKKIYDWLKENAAQYGFCQPYTEKNFDRPYGYNEEKWHWSYKPLAQRYITQMMLRAEDSMIEGFRGANTATYIQVVDRYILGIDMACY